MSITSQQDLDGLREAGRIVRLTLEAMARHVRPGISTAELDAIGGAVLLQHGARSAPSVVYGFPGAVCISVNEEIVHGLPSDRVVEAGDLVKLDVVAEKNGYMADAAVTVVAAPAPEAHHALAACARRLDDQDGRRNPSGPLRAYPGDHERNAPFADRLSYEARLRR